MNLILVNDRWVLLVMCLSILDLRSAYRIYKKIEGTHFGLVEIYLICSYLLCAAMLPIVVLCNINILTFSTIYFLNEFVRYCILKLCHKK